MDKLLCLCHFCELHGPNVILTTHCVSRSDLDSLTKSKSRPENGRNTSSLASSMSSLPSTSLITDNSNLFNNEIHLLSDESSSANSHDCDGCSLRSKSMVGLNGFLSLSSDDKYGFITNSYPNKRHDSNSFAISNPTIRDACIRSLSCEVYDSGEGEGLIYFGDDQRAHILSHLFILRDSKARGFQRTYSILVMSRDKQQLLSDWDFYVKSIQQIVSRLKNKSKIIYESELTQTTCQQRRSLILDNVSNVDNARSLEDLLDRNRMNTHRTNSKARSLLDLTGDNTTFANLHIQFSWILYSVIANKSWASMVECPLALSALSSLCHIEHNLTLRNLYKLLGKDMFETVGYHTLIGNQVIVIDDNQNRVKSVVHCLSQLLPESCQSIQINVDNFDEAAKHNLVGVSTKDLLPNYVMESDFHVIITLKNKTSDKSKNLSLSNTQVSVHSKARLPERMPNLLTNIENILVDLSYSDSTFNSYLVSLKNEWFTRAQTLYSYTKGVNPPRSQSQISALFRLIQSEDCDIKLLNFWSNSGLKYEYKTKVFSINSEMNLFN